ncbi:MAG: hypothetical protein AAF394_19425, partial [Planctomycetota bacterium]
ALGQLTVLSAGDEVATWRQAQLASLKEQLEATKPLSKEMQDELASQTTWLELWKPGGLSSEPSWKQAASNKPKLVEPVVDPNRKAARLRRRLLGPKARPTQDDTQALARLMRKYPQDVGVRQLHLHWLDQRQYRKEYAPDIAELAAKLDVQLQQLKQTDQVVSARAFCLYRRARALAYRELPEVITKHPIEDKKSHEAALLGTYRELMELVGEGRPEFVLLKIRLLRRDGWYGRALRILEEHGRTIDRQWYLKKRRDLLKELGWGAAYTESAEIYAQEFPEAVEAENKAS